MMAEKLIRAIQARYHPERSVTVGVFEDGEVDAEASDANAG